MVHKELYKILSAAFIAIILVGTGATAQAQNKASYKPTTDFDSFWSQVREAFLKPDPAAIAVLTKGGKFQLRGELLGLDMNKKCEYEAGKAYLTVLQKTFASRPGTSWKGFLEKHPKLNLKNDSSVTRGGLGEYRVHLKVSFVQNKKNKNWHIEELTDDLDRFYKWSKSAGGPARCD